MRSTAIKMLLTTAAAVVALGAGTVATSHAGLHVEVGYSSAPVDVRVWLDRGYDVYYGDADIEEVGTYYDVYPSVDDVVLYVRAARHCYATVYVIDTEGFLHVVYPISPYDGAYLVGGRVYRLWLGDFGFRPGCFGRGVAFAFAVTSPVPFAYAGYGPTVFGPHIGYQIYGDPFIASRVFYLSILPPACHRGVVSVSYARFYVREYVRYPSYLCLGWCEPNHVGAYYGDGCGAYRQYRVHAKDPYRVLRPSVSVADEVARHTRIMSTGAKDVNDVRITKRVEPGVKDSRDVRVLSERHARDSAKDSGTARVSTEPRRMDDADRVRVSKPVQNPPRNERVVRSTRESYVSSKQNYERMREIYERSVNQDRVEARQVVKKAPAGNNVKTAKVIQRAVNEARKPVTLGDASPKVKREAGNAKRETANAKREAGKTQRTK